MVDFSNFVESVNANMPDSIIKKIRQAIMNETKDTDRDSALSYKRLRRNPVKTVAFNTLPSSWISIIVRAQINLTMSADLFFTQKRCC